MVDGATSLMGMVYGLFAVGYWQDERGAHRLDSGTPWYEVYETADGCHVAIGCTKPSFFRDTLTILGFAEGEFGNPHDCSAWPRMKDAFGRVFRTRTRDEWCAAFEGTKICFSPVPSLAEAPRDPHQVARGNFVECAGVLQPAPALRFSRSRPAIQGPPPEVGQHTHDVLRDWGFGPGDVASLQQSGAI